MDIDDVLLEAEEKMERAAAVFADDLKGIRAGTASPGLVESIRVNYYGSQVSLRQIANIGVPDPQLIVIRPYDPSAIQEIVKAIQTSDIGINPKTDGKVIRLAVPGLSEERRKQLVARIKDMAEEARVAVRNIRRDANKHLDKLEKDGVASEDECERARKEVQELTDTYEQKVNELLERKSADIMKV